MLWLCLHFPSLPLEVFTRGVEAAGPFAVSVGRGSRRTVLIVNPEAEAQGIRPGMVLGAAYALASGLSVRDRDAAAEEAALAGLASWAGQFTPLVSLVSPPFPAVLLEVGGSRTLFQGLEKLIGSVEKGLSRLGYRSSFALAPTPLAAELLARSGKGAWVTEIGRLEASLSELPLEVLGLSGETREALRGMGIRTVGRCLGLPRTGLARRFGREFLEILDKALGKVPDPRPAVSPPPRFESRLELPAEVWSSEALLFALQRLLAELEGFLRAKGSGVRGISVDLCHRDRNPTRLELGLAAPRRNTRHLLALLRERMERVALLGPVSSLRLTATHLFPFLPRTQELFAKAGAGTAGEDGSHLLERLQARLGAGAVQGLRLASDHRPERASQLCPPQEGEERSTVRFGGRPLWLLPEPRPLPRAPISRRSEAPTDLALIAGPERIESGWWDGVDVTRDYYLAEDSCGSLLWVFRELRREGRWFVHGIFG